MEEQNIQNDENWKGIEKSHRRGKIMGGLLIVVIGLLFLGRELGLELPYWLLSWKMLLIGLGVVLAVKHKFRHPGWFFLIAIGGVFLMNDIYPDLHIKPILWPIVLILIGLAIMFKPRNRSYHANCRQWKHRRKGYYRGERQDFFDRVEPSKEDYIDSTAFMAGVKKNILSKNFKGGEITNVFGGTELNLTQADFEGTASLDLTQVFGGTKLILPANWEIKSELITVFGSVEDKRPILPHVSGESTKVLILKGTTVLGGIEIRTF
jgi:predicted membrane protein